MTDNINHPPHYTSSDAVCSGCEKTIECIDITRHMNFNLGNAMKYIWRAEHKGNKEEDIRKAMWYLNDELRLKKLDYLDGLKACIGIIQEVESDYKTMGFAFPKHVDSPFVRIENVVRLMLDLPLRA